MKYLLENKTLSIDNNSIEILKYLAILFMLIDHTGLILLSEYEILRIVGRLSYPLFAIVLVYNYIFNSKNKSKYIQRVFLLALISEPFYYYCVGQYQEIYALNIFFTLFFGLAFIYLFETYKNYTRDFLLFLYLFLLIFLIPFLDYGIIGVGLIISLYFLVNKINIFTLFVLMLCIYLLNPYDNIYIRYTAFATILIVLLVTNNHLFQIKRLSKFFYYSFYPIHLVVLKIIQNLI